MTEELALCEETTPDDVPTDWQAERKLDGIRAYSKNGRLFTRSDREITRQFPEIDPPEATVDGELVLVNGDFDQLLGRVQLTNDFDIEMRANAAPAQFVAFDVLRFNGEDLRDRPLVDRSGHLHAATKAYRRVHVIEPHENPVALWQQAVAEGWEGIVIKDPAAPYPSGRSDTWLKVKTWNEETFPIIDHERTDQGGFVIYVDVGTDELQKVVVNGQDDQRAVVAGAVEAEVQYLERSKNDRLRKPSVKRVR